MNKTLVAALSLTLLITVTGCVPGTVPHPTKTMSAQPLLTISYNGSTFVKAQVWSDAEFQTKEQKSYSFGATIDDFPAYFPVTVPSKGSAASIALTEIVLHEGNAFVLYKRQ